MAGEAKSAHQHMGLRERKRRATENAIELAAVDLALVHGFSSVTVEQICERADISRSTFFNYYPTRDSAILGRPLDIEEELADAVLEQSDGDVAIGLFKVMTAAAGHGLLNADVLRKRIQLQVEQPDTVPFMSYATSRLRSQMVTVLLRWLTLRPELRRLPAGQEVEEALLLVGALGSVAEVLLMRWAAMEGDVQMDPADVRAGVDQLRTVLGPSDAAG